MNLGLFSDPIFGTNNFLCVCVCVKIRSHTIEDGDGIKRQVFLVCAKSNASFVRIFCCCAPRADIIRARGALIQTPTVNCIYVLGVATMSHYPNSCALACKFNRGLNSVDEVSFFVRRGFAFRQHLYVPDDTHFTKGLLLYVCAIGLLWCRHCL